MKHIMANLSLSRIRRWLALGACLALASCGGPNYCACLDEAKKEIPAPKVMQQCREQFASMDEAAIKTAVDKCAKQ
jgi:hypothetical protein